ncbi:MAG: hypothetical protein M1834_007367 [Cirrosporium novae-zelandiae]|nr:MAG: hypothetical protein M1834_007367 [Cirrosporium novae-zelandiae]
MLFGAALDDLGVRNMHSESLSRVHGQELNPGRTDSYGRRDDGGLDILGYMADEHWYPSDTYDYSLFIPPAVNLVPVSPQKVYCKMDLHCTPALG